MNGQFRAGVESLSQLYKFQKGRGRLEGISRGDADIQLETVLQIRFSDENPRLMISSENIGAMLFSERIC
jgi:hypothetical protein